MNQMDDDSHLIEIDILASKEILPIENLAISPPPNQIADSHTLIGVDWPV
jgi:hypothetical protein